jgi:hypothetical protein
LILYHKIFNFMFQELSQQILTILKIESIYKILTYLLFAKIL